MPRCPFCDGENPRGASLCATCGATIEDAAIPGPSASVPDDAIRAALAAGRKIEAIKLYREQTGVGLKEAKDAIDALERGLPVPTAGQADPDVESECVRLVGEGRKIEAIKLYRERTRLGLKDARDAVERLAARHGVAAPERAGCLGMLVLMVLTGAAAVLS